MITRTDSITKFITDYYNVKSGTQLGPNLYIQINTLYNIEIFNIQQSSSYVPHTLTNGLIYSGNLYFKSSNDVCNIVEYVQDQLKYNEIPSSQQLWDTYKNDEYLAEVPLLYGNKSPWNTNNIFYVYITDPVTTSTLQIALSLLPSYVGGYLYSPSYVSQEFSDPILDLVSPRQMMPITRYSNDPYFTKNTYEFRFHKADRTQIVNTVTGSYLGSSTGIITAFLNMKEIINMSEIPEIDEFHFTRYIYTGWVTSVYHLDHCSKYCLYYRNLKGGWDWLVVRGAVSKTYNFKSSTYNNDYNLGSSRYINVLKNTGNFTTLVRNKNLRTIEQYKNDITTKLKINLGWFTDEQSAKLINLFSSPLVYIHNFAEDLILPVIITDKSLSEKKYIEGKTVNKAVINVELNENYTILYL